ncbi:hypothetical protein ACUTAH_02640 [Metapseudomonas furukawaii]|uniref:hypothetical protein n=1 Tax=Metapseudomonas furukawaii TaxID=1149133 RepID=UPI0040451CCB
MQLFINNWSATLEAELGLGATSLIVDPAQAAKLIGLTGSTYYLLTLVAFDVQGRETSWEIVKVTAKASGTLTIARAQEGTPANLWPEGSLISARSTAATLGRLRDAAGAPVGDAVPRPGGTASAGTSENASREDHVHALPTPGDIGAASAAQGAKADTAVQPAALTAGLADKVDKLTGYGLSQENFTPDEKAKLAGLESSHFKGLFASLEALQTAFPSAVSGDYADVDAGAGTDVQRYLWDPSDEAWVAQAAGGGSMTPAEVKAAYESNPDTNAFSDAEKAKLAGIATGATANADTDSLAEGSSNQYFTAARVRAVVLTGLSLAVGTAIEAADSVLVALGKLQRQITDLATSVAGKMANPMTTAGDLIVGGSSGAPQRLAKGADGQVLTMVSGAEAWATPAAGGLVRFTEGMSTAAPNSTGRPVVYLLATNTAVDVDVALVPKGIGSFSLRVPNGNNDGGNKRGQYAVDLQLGLLGGPGQVASGNYSVISGGRQNTASGSTSVIAGGSSNEATGSYSCVFAGEFNSATGAYASVHGGESNLASGDYSWAPGGLRSTTRGSYGVEAVASGRFSTAGDAQRRRWVMRTQTTDATATKVSADGAAASATNQVVLPDDSSYSVRGFLIARDTANGDTSHWEFKAALRRGTGAGTAALVGSASVVLVTQDSGASSWGLALAADTTLGGLSITVTGAASRTIRWVADVMTVEVIG